jgi:hypothetical protein
MFNMSASMKMMDTTSMIFITEKLHMLEGLIRSSKDKVVVQKAIKEMEDYKNNLDSKMLDDKRKFEME